MAQYGYTAQVYIAGLLEKLGFVKGAYHGVLQVIEKLKRPPKTIEKIDDHTFRYKSDDVKNDLKVEAPVHTLLNNVTIHNHFYRPIAAPVERDDAKTVTLMPKARGKAVSVSQKSKRRRSRSSGRSTSFPNLRA